MLWRSALRQSAWRSFASQTHASADTLAALLKGWLAAGPVHGVYWLPALDPRRRL